MSFITRFAPSPTGLMHLGNAYSALLAFDAANAVNGRFLLRIEDIDQTRCKPEFEAAVYEDLGWLGLEWEQPVRRQSDHFADYAGVIDRLAGMGVVYRCFLSRRELAEASLSAPHGPDGAPPAPPRISPDEEAERLARGEAFAWRLNMGYSQDLLGEEFARLEFEETGTGPNGERGTIRARPEVLGDVILGRKDTPASYHVAVVHDDALQGVTDIIRGQDLFESTHVHVLLQRLLGLPTPRYRHHALLTGPDGRRFAKRDASLTLRALREAGLGPQDVRARAGLPEA
jgi:glutamyl-Q tRNA(Asp) synthetase